MFAKNTGATLRGARRVRLAPLLVLLSAVFLIAAPLKRAFVTGKVEGSIRTLKRILAESEDAPPASSSSAALVKVTEENKVTTASVVGGTAGLLLGGVWIGGAAFAASSYLARNKDDDVSKALKGVASAGLEAVNFAGEMNEKYELTNKVGDAVKGAVDKAKENPDTKETVTQISGFFDGVADAVQKFDDDVGFVDTLGGAVTSASELASTAVDKAVGLNKQYKVTDQISDKIQEVIKSSK